MSKKNLKDTLPEDIVDSMAPQLRRVYDYLQGGRALSGMIAMNTLNCQNLTTRISELRRKGLNVQSKWSKDHNKTRYMKYWVNTNRPATEDRS